MEIRKLAANAPYAGIAEQFGVSVNTVYDVASGRRWKEAA